MNRDDDKIIVLNPSEEVSNVARNLTASRLVEILDCAENGDTRDLFALYRDVLCDTHIQAEFGKRKAAVLGDTRTMVPYDIKSEADKAAVSACWSLVESRDFADCMSWLLNATLYPVAVVEKVFAPTPAGYAVAALRPVPFAMLDLSQGDVRVFRVLDGRIQHDSEVASHDRYIVHRGHTMPIPDRWGGPMRALLFWWLLRTMSRQWWANLIERYGTPFMKGTYKDEEGRHVLERAFSLATKLGGIVLSAGTQAEVVSTVASANADAHEKFIECCNREISKLVVGQTLSAQAAPTGELGSGTATLQGAVRDDLRKMDATMLATTLRDGLLTQFCRVNGVVGRAPILLFGSDSAADLDATLGIIRSLSEAGFEPDDDGQSVLAERVGFGIRRKTTAMQLPFSAVPLSRGDSVEDRVAPSMAAELSQAFRGRFANVARMIRESESPKALESSIREWALSTSVGDVSDIIEQALAAYALAGIDSAIRQP